MFEIAVAVTAFLCVASGGLGALAASAKLSDERNQETVAVVRLIANILVVMTSLMLGLMLNSAKNTLETNNRNLRALSTNLILLDRTLRSLGPEAEESRHRLAEYVRTSLREQNILEEDPEAETLLSSAGASIRAIRVADEQKVALWDDALKLYRQSVQQRWVVVDASGGSIPMSLTLMLVVWLTVIFASFAYKAPTNSVVVHALIIGALLASGALYLILDMDRPGSGLNRTSASPFQRALAEMER
jgi:hypothetical protein